MIKIEKDEDDSVNNIRKYRNNNVTKTVDGNILNWQNPIIPTKNIPLKWIISLFIGCIGVIAAELPPVIRIGKCG